MPWHLMTLAMILGGGTSALLSISFVSGNPGMMFLANLAPLPLFLVGLGQGVAAGGVAVAAGLVVSGLLGGMVALGMYGVVHALPSWLAIRQALQSQTAPDGTTTWYPLGGVLCWLTAFGGAVMLATAIFSSGHAGGFQAAVSAYLEQILRIIGPTMTADERGQFLEMLVPFFPGSAVVSWLAVLAGNGLLAQSLLVRTGRNIRPRPSATDAVLPDWMSWLIVGASAVALVGSGDIGFLGRNLAMVMAVPFFVLGVAVVHTLAHRAPSRGMVLIAFYLVVLVSGWARLAVAGLGLIEQWVGIRRRFAGGGPVQEDE